MELRGYIDRTAEGKIRVHQVGNPTVFVEVDPSDVASYKKGDIEHVGVAVLKDSAQQLEGRLDDEAFASLFSHEGIPARSSAFHRETAFKYCYSWNPPGGGGYC